MTAAAATHHRATRRAWKVALCRRRPDDDEGDIIIAIDWTVASEAPAIVAAVRLRPRRGYRSRNSSYRAQSAEAIPGERGVREKEGSRLEKFSIY